MPNTLKVDKTGAVDYSGLALTNKLQENVELMKRILDNVGIAKFREVTNFATGLKCCVIFLDGMTNGELINMSIINSIKRHPTNPVDLNSLVNVTETEEETEIKSLVDSVMYGDSLLFADGFDYALVINSKGFSMRGVGEPDSEKALLGPREGFVESLMANLSLIGRRLVTSDYKIEHTKVGTRTNTRLSICYLDSLVDKKILADVKNRLDSIQTDGVLDANYIIESIKDSPLSPFKTVGSTEKPDIVVSRLLEGRVAIVVDGSCVVITAPYTFEENFQSPDDYYLNFYYASFGRILRYLAFFLAISLPAIYVALLSFHPEMLPYEIIHMLVASTSDVPFPTLVECLLMLVLFEILKETGMRASNKIGQSMGLLGGIVMGEAAIVAGLISAPMLIIVAFSVMTGLLTPRLSTPILLYRIAAVAAAALFGLVGYFMVMMVLTIQIFSLKSFGNWYTVWQCRDSIIRLPMWKQRGRPQFALDKERGK